MQVLTQTHPTNEGPSPTSVSTMNGDSSKQDTNGHGSATKPTPNTHGTPKMNGEKHSSPLKAAADLIQSLDVAYAEMNSNVANAARDAEDARRNARTASEIARRYSQRSYPKGQSTFGLSSTMSPFSSPGTPGRKYDYDYYNHNHYPSLSDSDTKSTKNNVNDNNNNGSGAHTPLREGQNQQSSSAGRIKRGFKPPSSVERMAQSHAEDVLSLSLDLERAKQAVTAEKASHEETKLAMTSLKSKNGQLEAQIQKLLNDMETQREEAGRKMDALEQELSHARMRMEAAEEDAQLALDLAKENSESRQQTEIWLQKALEELQVLRDSSVSESTDFSGRGDNSKKSVRFADESKTVEHVDEEEVTDDDETNDKEQKDHEVVITPKQGPPRAMVVAGRQIFNRSIENIDGDNDDDDNVYHITLTPEKSAERRRRLRERLRNLDQDLIIPTPPHSAKSPSPRIDSGFSTMAMEQCKNAAKILQESGQRLDLSGHWWRGHKLDLADVHLDAMARQYCQSVEVKIERHSRELYELEALCGYLEKKLGAGNV